MTKKGLGRGFASLIPSDLLDESFDPTAAQDERISQLRYIKLERIEVDKAQPRRYFDDNALGELAASIKEHGVLQPIVVTPAKDGFRIVAGERRYRAAKLAKIDKIPAIVRTLSDQHRLELSLIENIQRRDLSPIETATAYAKLRDQFNLNLEEIGQRVGSKSISTISNTLRLLKLPKFAQQELLNGSLTEGQARPLVGVDETVVKEILPRIIKEGWSARAVERFVAQLKRGHRIQKAVEKNQTFVKDAQSLGERLSAPVDIRVNSRGNGKIVISFTNQDDLERIKKLFI